MICLSLVVVLFIKFAAAIPADWEPRVQSFNAFFAEDDTAPLNEAGFPNIYLVSNVYIS